MRLYAVDDSAVGDNDIHQLLGVPIPNEKMATIRTSKDKVVAPVTALLDLNEKTISTDLYKTLRQAKVAGTLISTDKGHSWRGITVSYLIHNLVGEDDTHHKL